MVEEHRPQIRGGQGLQQLLEVVQERSKSRLFGVQHQLSSGSLSANSSTPSM